MRIAIWTEGHGILWARDFDGDAVIDVEVLSVLSRLGEAIHISVR